MKNEPTFKPALFLDCVEEPFVLRLKNAAGNEVTIDAAPRIGGKNKGLRPMELLAGSLAACISIDLLHILHKKRKQVTNFRVSVEGIRTESVPAAYEKLILKVEAEGVEKKELLKQAELVLLRYCSVAASLSPMLEIKLI